jgi:hypothetical protein
MARSIFFSFHYKDVSSFRANVVRNSWLTMRDRSAKFIDKSMWEEAERKGGDALKKLIADGLNGTSVTVVLVGNETYGRRWVRYEILKSFVENKGIFPVHINRIRSTNEGITARGANPLDYLKLQISSGCKTVSFFELVDRKWIPFNDLISINNRQANSVYFENGWFSDYKCGRDYKFSEIFHQEYDWVIDDGYKNFPLWIEESAKYVGRD